MNVLMRIIFHMHMKALKHISSTVGIDKHISKTVGILRDGACTTCDLHLPLDSRHLLL